MTAVERSLDELWEMYGNGERYDEPTSTKSIQEWAQSIEKKSYDDLPEESLRSVREFWREHFAKPEPEFIKVNQKIENQWKFWDPPCYPPCNQCWEVYGYEKRSKWLTEWLTRYIENEAGIINGTKTMPELDYDVNDNKKLVIHNLDKCHNNRCKKSKSYSHCDCNVSHLMRNIWGDDAKDEYGVIDILQRYKNIKKKLRFIQKHQ